jgi:purine-binding chemotaxis protein CheW
MAMLASGSDSYVVFELAGASYALRSDDVQQLEMVVAPTPVPNAPPYVDGVVAVRGQVIPAVSLRVRFGFPRQSYDVRTRLIVVRAHGRTVGLIVDSAREFASIAPESIEPLPNGIGDMSGRYLRGIAHKGDRLLLLVDVTELLDHDVVVTADDDAESRHVVASPEPQTAAGAGTLN